MDFFRKMIIGTLQVVAVLFFFGAIVVFAWTGYESGGEIFIDAAREAGTEAAFTLPSWVWAIIGAVAGWVWASVVLGILFVLLDIQDGIRDLNRALTKKDGQAKTA
jgi:hypothetical protein